MSSMDSSRFLIVGAYGQIGTALQEKYPEAKAVDRDAFDLTNWDMLSNYDWSGVDVILNAAAYTNVDGAETAEGRVAAWAINSTGPGYLSKVAAKQNLTLVHISTDYVFDGSKTPHAEDEPFAPLGVYGQSKAAGDIAVSISPKHYILRTSWVIGEGNNFVRTMMGLAEKNISPTVVHDQIGRLNFTSDLVRAIDYLLINGNDYGTYNASNGGEPASWADITREIFSLLKRDDLTVTNTSTEDYYSEKIAKGVLIAPRPLQSTLDLTKLQATGFKSRDWREDLRQYIEKELEK